VAIRVAQSYAAQFLESWIAQQAAHFKASPGAAPERQPGRPTVPRGTRNP
jgi:hypothetical protein